MSKTIETPKAWIPDENRVLRISNDMDVLINFNQYNETRGGLIIDHKNQQFALWAGQGMGPDTGHAERTTMKKIVERANELRRRGYAEGVVSNEFARTSLFRHQPRHEQEKIVEMHAWLEMNSKEKPAPHFMKRQGFGGPVKDDEKRDSIAAAKSVLKRLGDAGIEVSWNREEFQRVLETSEKLNKMVRKLDDFEEKRKELDVLHNEKDEIEKEIETAEKARKEAEKETYNEDFVDFKRTLLLLKDFIDKDILEKIKQETGLKIKKTAKGDIILDLNEFETYMVEMDKDKWGMDYEEDGEDMFDVFKEPCSSAVMKLETMKETISKNFLSKKIEDIIYGSLVEKINRARKDMEKDIDTVFINKNVGTLTAKESYELKEKLLKLPYVEINGIKLYANKIDEAVEKENFLGELGISSILENHGYEVFILPEQYTENNSHADGLAKKEGEENFEFIDLKNLSAKNLRTVGERFRHGKEQGRNVLIYLQEDFSNQELVKEINWEIKNKLPAESINGVLIVMFEKSNQYIEYAIKKDGIQPITKDSVRPSARAGVAEATTPLKNSVSQEDSLVNRKTPRLMRATREQSLRDTKNKPLLDRICDALEANGFGMRWGDEVFDYQYKYNGDAYLVSKTFTVDSKELLNTIINEMENFDAEEFAKTCWESNIEDLDSMREEYSDMAYALENDIQKALPALKDLHREIEYGKDLYADLKTVVRAFRNENFSAIKICDGYEPGLSARKGAWEMSKGGYGQAWQIYFTDKDGTKSEFCSQMKGFGQPVVITNYQYIRDSGLSPFKALASVHDAVNESGYAAFPQLDEPTKDQYQKHLNARIYGMVGFTGGWNEEGRLVYSDEKLENEGLLFEVKDILENSDLPVTGDLAEEVAYAVCGRTSAVIYAWESGEITESHVGKDTVNVIAQAGDRKYNWDITGYDEFSDEDRINILLGASITDALAECGITMSEYRDQDYENIRMEIVDSALNIWRENRFPQFKKEVMPEINYSVQKDEIGGCVITDLGAGRDVYLQPGDEANEMLDKYEKGEVPDSILSEYFADGAVHTKAHYMKRTSGVTEDDYEKYLNETFDDNYYPEDLVEEYIYLEGHEYDGHKLKRKEIENAAETGSFGKIIRQYDPVRFAVGYDEYIREYLPEQDKENIKNIIEILEDQGLSAVADLESNGFEIGFIDDDGNELNVASVGFEDSSDLAEKLVAVCDSFDSEEFADDLDDGDTKYEDYTVTNDGYKNYLEFCRCIADTGTSAEDVAKIMTDWHGMQLLTKNFLDDHLCRNYIVEAGYDRNEYEKKIGDDCNKNFDPLMEISEACGFDGEQMATVFREWCGTDLFSREFMENYFENILEMEQNKEARQKLIDAGDSISDALSDAADELRARYLYLSQNFVKNGIVYGIAFDGKILLNPDAFPFLDEKGINERDAMLGDSVRVLSETLPHEWTHLWDEYTMRTNPELWDKWTKIVRDTRAYDRLEHSMEYKNEINACKSEKEKTDYIASELHARAAGKFGKKILERIAREDGKITKESMKRWMYEANIYVAEELGLIDEIGFSAEKVPSAKEIIADAKRLEASTVDWNLVELANRGDDYRHAVYDLAKYGLPRKTENEIMAEAKGIHIGLKSKRAENAEIVKKMLANPFKDLVGGKQITKLDLVSEYMEKKLGDVFTPSELQKDGLNDEVKPKAERAKTVTLSLRNGRKFRITHEGSESCSFHLLDKRTGEYTSLGEPVKINGEENWKKTVAEKAAEKIIDAGGLPIESLEDFGMTKSTRTATKDPKPITVKKFNSLLGTKYADSAEMVRKTGTESLERAMKTIAQTALLADWQKGTGMPLSALREQSEDIADRIESLARKTAGDIVFGKYTGLTYKAATEQLIAETRSREGIPGTPYQISPELQKMADRIKSKSVEDLKKKAVSATHGFDIQAALEEKNRKQTMTALSRSDLSPER